MSNETIINAPGEITKRWEELTADETMVALQVHAIALRITKSSKAHQTLKRLFDLGKPKIVFGYKEGKPSYCRIHDESCDVMKILIRQYL